MTVARRRLRPLVALLIVVWMVAGVWGAAAYGVSYWFHRGFAPPKWPARVPHGVTEQVLFRSAAVGGPSSYIVHLPPGYAAAARRGQRFGVLYLLHGTPGTAQLLMDVSRVAPVADTLMQHHRIRPMIIVAPSGDPSTFSDTEWADTPSGRWGTYLIDVVHSVDARFATRADRGHRAIAGLSEGGYGALNTALRHLGLFSVAESWSGYFRQTHSGVFAHATPAQLAAASPVDYVGGLAPALRRLDTHVLLYTGRSDKTYHPSVFFGFAARLRAAGAAVTTRTYPGGHSWPLWRREMPMSLEYADRWMAP